MFAYHKDLFPVNSSDVLTMLFSAVGLVIAAGGGIGGGGILVPLFMLFLGFRPKHAIALSNFTILGGSISNTLFNVQKSSVSGAALIDWDIIVMMEPSTIAGAVIGSFASKYLPDFVLTICLSIVLAMLAYRTLSKGISMFARETEEEAKLAERGGGSDQEEAQTLINDASPGGYAPEQMVPWGKIGLLILCFAGCVVLTVLKGSAHGSIIGVECGSLGFWVLGLACVPWVILFGWLFRYLLLTEMAEKERDGQQHQKSDIKWDEHTTIKYPLVCTLAGVFAGLFGVGGGIVKGPLMLEMGVNPLVAAATAATMILFTTSAACVSFEIFGLLEPSYGICCFVMGLVCTAVGQGAINVWMKSAKRQSPPVLSIGAVMAISSVLVALEGYTKFVQHDLDHLLRPSAICSHAS